MIRLVFVIVSMLLMESSSFGKEDSFEELLKRVKELKKEKKFDLAIKAVTQAIEKQTADDARLFALRGKLRIQKFEFQESTKAEKLESIDGNLYANMMYLGYKLASEKLKPKKVGDQKYFVKRDRKKRLQDFLAKYEDEQFGNEQRLRALQYASAINVAKKDLDKAIDLNPKMAEPHIYRAKCKLFEPMNALPDLLRALELDPDSYAVNSFVAIYMSNAYGAPPVHVAKKACELLGFKNDADLERLAYAYAFSKDYQNAVRYLQQALEVGPSNRVEIRKEMILELQASESNEKKTLAELNRKLIGKWTGDAKIMKEFFGAKYKFKESNLPSTLKEKIAKQSLKIMDFQKDGTVIDETKVTRKYRVTKNPNSEAIFVELAVEDFANPVSKLRLEFQTIGGKEVGLLSSDKVMLVKQIQLTKANSPNSKNIK